MSSWVDSRVNDRVHDRVIDRVSASVNAIANGRMGQGWLLNGHTGTWLESCNGGNSVMQGGK